MTKQPARIVLSLLSATTVLFLPMTRPAFACSDPHEANMNGNLYLKHGDHPGTPNGVSDEDFAEQFVIASDAAMEYIPDDLLSAGLQAIAVTARLLAKEVLHALQHTNKVKDECEGEQFSNEMRELLDDEDIFEKRLAEASRGIAEAITAANLDVKNAVGAARNVLANHMTEVGDEIGSGIKIFHQDVRDRFTALDVNLDQLFAQLTQYLDGSFGTVNTNISSSTNSLSGNIEKATTSVHTRIDGSTTTVNSSISKSTSDVNTRVAQSASDIVTLINRHASEFATYLDARFKEIRESFGSLGAHIDARFVELREAMAASFDRLTKSIDSQFRALTSYLTEQFTKLFDLLETKFGAVDTKLEDKFNGVNVKLDQQLRLAIEDNLLGGDDKPLAAFVLPVDMGGYIDAEPIGVKAVVHDAFDKMLQARQTVGPQILADLTAADAALVAGQYKAAYRLYSKAYLGVVR